MLGFIKKCFLTAMMFFGCNLSNVNSLKCILMNNEEFIVRSEIVNVNSNDPVFFTFSLKQINVVVVVILSTIHNQNCVFLLL